ncbi:hypothetical protein CVT26_014295 [Gymnopilus dilepis]|uniref:Uncharacterized protein n=1 Tax=Gymnopilus dilepis TaxID=231916 RepID=A0A409Y964_9AGAR|nr:hypothetical protein CVT26_014295 [Gymnopilus dilepis]
MPRPNHDLHIHQLHLALCPGDWAEADAEEAELDPIRGANKLERIRVSLLGVTGGVEMGVEGILPQHLHCDVVPKGAIACCISEVVHSDDDVAGAIDRQKPLFLGKCFVSEVDVSCKTMQSLVLPLRLGETSW